VAQYNLEKGLQAVVEIAGAAVKVSLHHFCWQPVDRHLPPEQGLVAMATGQPRWAPSRYTNDRGGESQLTAVSFADIVIKEEQ
jgi:hypothetical protein